MQLHRQQKCLEIIAVISGTDMKIKMLSQKELLLLPEFFWLAAVILSQSQFRSIY